MALVNITRQKKRLNRFSLFVPKAGIEPAHLTVHDFESCASTSSATQASPPFMYW